MSCFRSLAYMPNEGEENFFIFSDMIYRVDLCFKIFANKQQFLLLKIIRKKTKIFFFYTSKEIIIKNPKGKVN